MLRVSPASLIAAPHSLRALSRPPCVDSSPFVAALCLSALPPCRARKSPSKSTSSRSSASIAASATTRARPPTTSRLDSYDRVRKGGASGEAIAPGDVDGSYLFKLVTHKDQPHMPPGGGKIPADKIEIIRQWIAGGALEGFRLEGRGQEAGRQPGHDRGGRRGPPARRVMPEGVSRRAGRLHGPRRPRSPRWPPAPGRRWWRSAASGRSFLYNTDSSELAGHPAVSRRHSLFAPLQPLRQAAPGRRRPCGGQGPGRRLRRPQPASGLRRSATSWTPYSPPTSTRARRSSRSAARKSWSASSTSADGAAAVEIRKHTDWITAVEFSPDGVLLATADRAGGVWVWEAGTDREFQALEGHKAAVTAMSWRDDSNVLATAGEDGIDHALGGSRTASGSRTSRPIPAASTSLQFLHDGRLVSGGRDHASSSGMPPATRSASSSPAAKW